MSFWSGVKEKLLKADLALGGAFVQSVNVIKETVNRGLSLPDVAGQAVGLVPTKKLRLRVIILRDEASVPLADLLEVLPSIEAAQAIFERQLSAKIIPAGDQFIETLDHPSPVEALDTECDFKAWKEDFKQAGGFFETYIHNHTVGALTGYASPITVFIVREVGGKAGCSLGPLTDYVTLGCGALGAWGSDEEGRMIPRVLAHEIGHACGLWHVRDSQNLMHPWGPGTHLHGWQKIIARNSRHLTYF